MTIVGIDLGTTNSAAATIWMGRPEIIPNGYGGRTTPSVVGITKTNKIIVGKKAKYQRVALRQNPITEIKRKMGQTCTVSFDDKSLTPQEISSYILKSIKMDCQNFLGNKVECAVITIPAYFNESARRATREAGELAGLHVGMILDEPTASALAYGVAQNKDETVLVYDLGGGTFDVSVIEIAGSHFEVLAIDGDTYLGGKDFDNILLDYVIHAVKRKYKIDLLQYPEILPELTVCVEDTKCDLSRTIDASVILPAFRDNLDIDIDIKRELLEELILPLVNSTLIPLQRVLQKANLEADEIDEVLLVGGSTRIPLVRQTVATFFGKEARHDIDPDECVALGAAVYTRLLDEEIREKYGGEMVWESQDRSAHSWDGTLVVVPRTAHSLGIGVDEGGGRFSPVLPASSFYPVSITKKDYFTAVDNQSGIEIWVYEGEDPIAQKNTPLGRILLDLPDGLPSGVPIWITFTLNESRILEVSVRLPDRPGVEAKARIDTQNRADLPSVQPANPHDGYVAIPQIHSLKHQVDTIEHLLETHRKKIPQSRHAQIQWALDSARHALASGDVKSAQEKVSLLDHLRDELLRLEN